MPFNVVTSKKNPSQQIANDSNSRDNCRYVFHFNNAFVCCLLKIFANSLDKRLLIARFCLQGRKLCGTIVPKAFCLGDKHVGAMQKLDHVRFAYKESSSLNLGHETDFD